MDKISKEFVTKTSDILTDEMRSHRNEYLQNSSARTEILQTVSANTTNRLFEELSTITTEFNRVTSEKKLYFLKIRKSLVQQWIHKLLLQVVNRMTKIIRRRKTRKEHKGWQILWAKNLFKMNYPQFFFLFSCPPINKTFINFPHLW